MKHGCQEKLLCYHACCGNTTAANISTKQQQKNPTVSKTPAYAIPLFILFFLCLYYIFVCQKNVILFWLCVAIQDVAGLGGKGASCVSVRLTGLSVIDFNLTVGDEESLFFFYYYYENT